MTVYKINGKVVSAKQFRRHKTKAQAGAPHSAGRTFRPSQVISSMALACHPADVPRMEEICQSHGLNVHHNEHGEPQFDNFATRDKYAKLCGMHPMELKYNREGQRIKKVF